MWMKNMALSHISNSRIFASIIPKRWTVKANGLSIDYAGRSTIGYHKRIVNDQGKKISEPTWMLTTYQPWVHATKERYIDNLTAHWYLWIKVIRRNKVMGNGTVIEMYLNRYENLHGLAEWRRISHDGF